MSTRRTLLISILIHAGIFGVLFSGILRDRHSPERLRAAGASTEILVEVETRSKPSATTRTHSPRPRFALDLRPQFARESVFVPGPSAPSEGETQVAAGAETQTASPINPYAHQLLTTASKVTSAFDLLALKIETRLDYPAMLVGEGVEGTATLDLTFDSQARIDESRSAVSGGHRLIRGLLVRAVRSGLLDWYLKDASRLERDQFRNQHFHASFELSYANREVNRVDKAAEGTYNFEHRNQVQTCLNGVIDIACLAMKAAEAIKRTTDGYKIRLSALRDRLERYDELELRGMNLEIERSI